MVYSSSTVHRIRVTRARCLLDISGTRPTVRPLLSNFAAMKDNGSWLPYQLVRGSWLVPTRSLIDRSGQLRMNGNSGSDPDSPSKNYPSTKPSMKSRVLIFAPELLQSLPTRKRFKGDTVCLRVSNICLTFSPLCCTARFDFPNRWNAKTYWRV